MRIKSIHIYSHDGRRRDLHLSGGLNVITGRSSTGKSALSDIVEFCMGISEFRVAEGVIRDKVSWFAVVYQFEGEQILVAKPAPRKEAQSSSAAMIRRGADVSAPPFEVLEANTDDAAVSALLSKLLGIPENRTSVPAHQSRPSFSTQIKHTLYYLFQKQGLVANKDQLLYRQHEPFVAQNIQDTFPILVGVDSPERYATQARYRSAKRELNLAKKKLESLNGTIASAQASALRLHAEAVAVGLLEPTAVVGDVFEQLQSIEKWQPTNGRQLLPEPRDFLAAESKIRDLRHKRRDLQLKAETARGYHSRASGFESEITEQRDRLASIFSFPEKSSSRAWQWPFTDANVTGESQVEGFLLAELASLDRELEAVAGEKPRVDSLLVELAEELTGITEEIQRHEEQLASAVAVEEQIQALRDRSVAAARVAGRVSHFLETLTADRELADLEDDVRQLARKVDKLALLVGDDGRDDAISSVLNNISLDVTRFVDALDAEFAGTSTRFDLKKLTVVVDRPGRPVPMPVSGGGENHLAYHIATLFAIHLYAANNGCPIPSFLMIDQPTQVYFPSEEKYQLPDGYVEQTEADADMEAVRRLFTLFVDYVTNVNPGFQLIVTEHANLKEDWFQASLVEEPWSKPPALVPEDWPLPDTEAAPYLA